MDLISALRRLRVRVDAMVARAVIERVNDTLKTQRLQLTIIKDEVEDDVEHFQPYGLSFVPPEGAEALALAVGGARSHTIAICAQHPDKRPKNGAAGTGGLYTDGSWRVFIDASGNVLIGSDSADEPIPLGNALKAWLEALTVPTAMGPSGTPINAPLLAAVLSTKHKVE